MDNLTHLKKKLAELIALLQELKDPYWCPRLQNIEYKLNQGPLEEIGLYDLRKMFGGMGSLNDFYICEWSGHFLNGRSEKDVNNLVDELLTEIYEEAHEQYRKIVNKRHCLN